MTGTEAALAACRFGQAAAAMLLWGGLGFLAVLTPPAAADAVSTRLHWIWPWATLTAAAATLATLPVEIAQIGSGWQDVLSASVWSKVLFETGAGQAWQQEAAAALLLLAARLTPVPVRRAATALAAGLILTSLALTGHAAMHMGWLGLAQRANATVHVLAAGSWLGALVPLLPTLAMLDGPHGREAVVALHRFSAVGHAAVGLVLLTGALNAALILGGWPSDPGAPYQALLLTKIAVVALMIGLATLNRYRFVPRIARHPALALTSIRRATYLEIALGLGALALVAVFGLLEPA
ncbi:copper homeostasis membrane protein CopD [Methylobacterium fujisawaense]|uniref:copper homeostasis membrane protein CopD n=1 Tax=Methylobacterium fujisawaense TaxID=107400 RepID=UPI0036F5A7A8